jgi:hypothetical protein
MTNQIFGSGLQIKALDPHEYVSIFFLFSGALMLLLLDIILVALL